MFTLAGISSEHTADCSRLKSRVLFIAEECFELASVWVVTAPSGMGEYKIRMQVKCD